MFKRLCRSALYVPGDNARAMAKASSINADILIFDLEDGVSPENKELARARVVELLETSPMEARYRVVRINHFGSEWAIGDLKALCRANADAIMLPKVEHSDEIQRATTFLDMHNVNKFFYVWANVETPKGIANIEEISSHGRLKALVAGTNDLRSELRLSYEPTRLGLLFSLQRIQMAARAHGLMALDGTFINLHDEEGLRAEAAQGRLFGFDGKTAIHPKQVDIINETFSPSEEDIAHAHAVISTYKDAMREDRAVAVLENGQMIERLHYDRAREVLDMVESIEVKSRHSAAS